MQRVKFECRISNKLSNVYYSTISYLKKFNTQKLIVKICGVKILRRTSRAKAIKGTRTPSWRMTNVPIRSYHNMYKDQNGEKVVRH